MTTPLLRSHLYAPGSNERILAKVLDAGADAVILDLEDGVAASAKNAARDNVAALIAERSGDAACELHVRVNRHGDGWSRTDLEAVVQPGLSSLRLPKSESASAIAEVAALISELEAAAGMTVGTVRLGALVESALGAVRIPELVSAPRVAQLSFGSVDFLADLGARGGGHGLATATTRGIMVLHSRAAGIAAPVDNVHTRLDDLDELRAECVRGRDLGFFGKGAIHPKQLDVIHEVFAPTAEELEWAHRVNDAFLAAEAEGIASITVDGEFVDPAVVARATGLLALADR